MNYFFALKFMTIIVYFSNTIFFQSSAYSKLINLAQNLSYQFNVAPNYKGALGLKGTELTDGVIGSGRYLSNGQAVGWSWKTPVIVTMDLGLEQIIGHVRVRAGAKTVGDIYFPAQIFVYGKDKDDSYSFLGASTVQKDADSTAGSTLRTFDIALVSRKIEKLLVVSFARGAFIFLSEIEAYQVPTKKIEKTVKAHSTVSLKSIKEITLDANFRHRKAIIAMPEPRPSGSDLARRWAMPLADMSSSSKVKSCLVQRVKPWTSHRKTGKNKTTTVERDHRLLAIVGGQDYAAWRIIAPLDADVHVKLSASGSIGVTTQIHALAHAQALDMSWVPDVVTPFKDTMLPAGSVITVLIKATPDRAGRSDVRVNIACGQYFEQFTMPLIAVVRDAAISQLHGNLWTYLHQDRHKPVAQGIHCDPHFLSRFGVDTVDVHPAALFPRKGKRPTKLLARYLSAYRNAKRIHLYMAMKSRSWQWQFMKMPDKAAAEFLRDWWHWVETIARQEKVKGELILYPVDEPKYQHIDMLAKMRRIVDLAGIKARIYTTATSKVAFLITGYVDLIQLHRPKAPILFILRVLGVEEIHGYKNRYDGKLLSIDKYYRQQGWRAYNFGLSGIGIWAMWDSTGLGDPKSGWNPFGLGRTRDFGMIYGAPDGCAWPSLRLLAWRRGIEENLMLRQCERYLPKWRIEKAVTNVLAAGLQKTDNDILMTCAQRSGGSR